MGRGQHLTVLCVFSVLLLVQLIVFHPTVGTCHLPEGFWLESHVEAGEGGSVSHKDLPSLTPPGSVSGRQAVILVFVQFLDVKNSTAIEAIMRMVCGPFCDYYSEGSYGKISIEASVHTAWITLPYPMAYYGADGAAIDVNGQAIFYDTVNLATRYVNFGFYNHLIIVHAGDDQALSRNTNDIWSAHYPSLRVPSRDAGGNPGGDPLVSFTITHGVIVAETDPMGVFAHEFGHSLGLPDLYDITYTQEFVGFWSLMGSGSKSGSPLGSRPTQLMSPERIWLGWITPNQIASITTPGTRDITLNSLETSGDTLAVKIPIDTTSYYTLEYRRKILFDQDLPMEGVIISYIDENLARGHGIVKVQDGTPNTPSLDDAAFTPGMKFVDEGREVAISILTLANTAQIQIQKGSAELKTETQNATENPTPSPTNFQVKIFQWLLFINLHPLS